MRLIYTREGGRAWDITALVQSASWAGDYKQAARTLDLEVLAGPRAGSAGALTAGIAEGEMVQLFDGANELFRGYVFTVGKSLGTSVRTIKCYDGAVYAAKSHVSHNFSSVTAQGVTRQVAAWLGLPVGAMPADKNLSLSFAHINKTMSSAIMGAWTKVAAVTGYKYILRMDRGALGVAIVGLEYAPFILSPDSTVVDGQVSSSIEDAVTQAVVADDKGRIKAVEVDAAARQKYGVLQATATSEKGVAPGYQAKKLLKGPQQEIELNDIIAAPGAHKLIAGNAAAVNDPVLGVTGRYFILNDTHAFRDGRHTVSVGLSFDALMDEQEIELIKKRSTAAQQEEEGSGNPWAGAEEYGRQP